MKNPPANDIKFMTVTQKAIIKVFSPLRSIAQK